MRRKSLSINGSRDCHVVAIIPGWQFVVYRIPSFHLLVLERLIEYWGMQISKGYLTRKTLHDQYEGRGHHLAIWQSPAYQE